MSIASEVNKRIEGMDEGALISYRAFDDLKNQKAVALALSRLCKQEKISRLQKGAYFKPKKSRFGDLGPDEAEIIRGLVEEGAYIAGIAAYNQLGLTTQVPNEITIKGSRHSRKTRIGKLKVRYVRDVKETYSASPILLQILDAFENIKSIPDADVTGSFAKLSQLVEDLNTKEQMLLAKLALRCKPSVRALVGAVLETIEPDLARKLKSSLNPLSSYRVGLAEGTLSNLNEWRIQ